VSPCQPFEIRMALPDASKETAVTTGSPLDQRLSEPEFALVGLPHDVEDVKGLADLKF